MFKNFKNNCLLNVFNKLSTRHKIKNILKNKLLLEILMCEYKKIFTLSTVAFLGKNAGIILINQFIFFKPHLRNEDIFPIDF